MKSLLAVVVAILMVFTVFLVITPAVAAPNDNASNKGPPELEKIVFIHYYKPSHVPGGSNCDDACQGNEDDKTFRLINGGIKWANLPIDYLISNQFSNSEATAIRDSADTWDDALDFRSGSTINLFDNPSSTVLIQANPGDNDGENIIVKGDLASNIIGVTSFWYNPATKEVVDADMVLNYDDFAWSTNDTPVDMDVQNIVTHELGHFLVLDDLSSPKTSDLTMYGFSGSGEIKGRTTGLGDELGVTKLYASSDTGETSEDGPDCTKSKSKKWC